MFALLRQSRLLHGKLQVCKALFEYQTWSVSVIRRPSTDAFRHRVSYSFVHGNYDPTLSAGTFATLLKTYLFV